MSHTGAHVLPPSAERSALCRRFAPSRYHIPRSSVELPSGFYSGW
jgi:hypothetical protein